MAHKYKAILLDLDDTLIDNDESIRYAIFQIYKDFGIPCNEKNYRAWKDFDDKYWSEWESGKLLLPKEIITLEKRIDYLRSNRFLKFFNIDYNTAIDINRRYINLLSKNIVAIEGAYDTVKTLHDEFEIVISTNGPEDCAIEKISAINLTPYIDKMACSGTCGFSKPMPGFFDYAIEMMKTKDKKKMVIVGDSLTTDILGGIKNGIDSCWFNPQSKENNTDIKPTYEIKKLKHLIKKL